jgi:hypothetical protein
MSAHTPGPWNMVEASGGWLIGPRETDGPDYVGDVHRLAKGRSDEESEANARLIATAPELLRALRDALPFINCRECELHNPYVEDIRDAARAAIAKARGES